jgi:protein-tyrosine-phosphatase
MKAQVLWVLLALVSSVLACAQDVGTKKQSARPPREIVFVCEHGAALSVVSAAYFNKLAKEQHLDMHAIARGITPQESLANSATNGLKADGVPSEVQKPQALSQDDLSQSDYVVTFFPLTEKYSTNVPVESWNDVPPTGAGYDKSRDAILKHMQPLLEKLKAETKSP